MPGQQETRLVDTVKAGLQRLKANSVFSDSKMASAREHSGRPDGAEDCSVVGADCGRRGGNRGLPQISVATVKCLCLAVSVPQSQVSDL